MTDTAIISKDMIRAKARDAFADGAGIDAHNMNPGAAAIEVWQDEWLNCARHFANLKAALIDSQLVVAGKKP